MNITGGRERGKGRKGDMERRRERGREGEKETGREGVRGRRVSQIVEQLTDKERERLRARDTRSGTYAKDTTRS